MNKLVAKTDFKRNSLCLSPQTKAKYGMLKWLKYLAQSTTITKITTNQPTLANDCAVAAVAACVWFVCVFVH